MGRKGGWEEHKINGRRSLPWNWMKRQSKSWWCSLLEQLGGKNVFFLAVHSPTEEAHFSGKNAGFPGHYDQLRALTKKFRSKLNFSDKERRRCSVATLGKDSVGGRRRPRGPYSCSVTKLFAASWTAAHQTSPSFPISWSLLKLTSTESVMPSKLTPIESEFAQTHVHWVGDAIESVMPSHPPHE